MEINTLFEMLDWHNDPELQQRGIDEAVKVKYISVFFRPQETKSVWENCAKVLAQKSDCELKNYTYKMFEWLQDMCWPGAEIIYERLQRMPDEFILSAYEYSLKTAKMTEDSAWKSSLEFFWKDKIDKKI